MSLVLSFASLMNAIWSQLLFPLVLTMLCCAVSVRLPVACDATEQVLLSRNGYTPQTVVVFES